jgi:hypothetical protein
MVEAGTLAVNADVVKAAGANASATAVAEAYTNVYIKMAEGFVSGQSRYDWVTNYASVSTIGKELLRDVTSAYAAIKAIEYDMSGFTSLTEAQTMLDLLWNIVVEGMNLLRDESFKEFVVQGDND